MDLPQPNFRSTTYFIAQRLVECQSCAASTRVAAVALPVDHEVLEEDEARGPGWQRVAANALLFYMTLLPATAGAHVHRLAPGFRLEDTGANGEAHWINHCEHCDEPLADDELHGEPGDSFVPINEADGARIQLTCIDEPLEAAAAGYSLEPQFLSFERPL